LEHGAVIYLEYMVRVLTFRQTAAIFGSILVLAWQTGSARSSHKERIAGDGLLWTDPGDVASYDFRYGIGGPENQPQPPFQFVNEDSSGTSKKVNVTDSRGRKWNVKWGHEARPSTFCTRLLWACGYFVETEYFLSEGQINGIHSLGRARPEISAGGSFVDARFQLRSDSPKYLKGQHWTWTKHPFVGTHELQGLKIMLLLLSNWDTKESNLSIFEDDGTGAPRYIYMDDDWGASLGKWGGTFSWTKWDCDGFAKQTPHFVKRAADGSLQWGFEGKNEKVVTSVTAQDVQWLLQYLGRVTDEQIRTGLTVSGATPQEVDCFAQSLRQRIDQLKQVSSKTE
jgi:hypothetical protein